MGARLITGARVRRIETNNDGLATGAHWIDRDGKEHFEPAKVVVLAANAIGTPRLLLLSASSKHPDGLANSSGLVGKRLMMHPFANVAGLFEEPLMSWQGQFGDLIESLEFYETDEKRGFVRGARWGLAPTGGPINTALPSRAGEQIWGPDHHLHVKSHLGHGANWGLFAEDLPDEANRVELSLDGDRLRRASPRRRSTTRWPTTRGACSTSTSSGRRSRWRRPAPTRSRSTG